MDIEDLKKETKAMGEKVEQSVEERLDRLEEALGVMNRLIFIMRSECKDNDNKPPIEQVKQIRRIYLETPTHIREIKESRERIEKMIEEDNK